MDADNRVILNCGGIRHEVYKVICLLISSLPKMMKKVFYIIWRTIPIGAKPLMIQ